MRLLITLLLPLCFSQAHAEIFAARSADGSFTFSDKVAAHQTASRLDRVANHKLSDDDLPGTWKTRSSDGKNTTLTLRDDGTFVIDQRDNDSPERLYMCGDWEQQSETLAFNVKAYKKRQSDGVTEQADGAFASQAPILSARRDRLIVQFEGQQLVLDRS